MGKKKTASERLETAYFKLLAQKHYSKITVSELIRLAGVSRTTFYRNYVDIFDMHRKVSEKLGVAIMDEFFRIVTLSQNERESTDKIIEIFNSQEKYIALISRENGSRCLFETMFDIVDKRCHPLFTHLTDEELFRVRFMIMAMMGIYIRDLVEERGHNPAYILICKTILNFNDLFGGNYAKQH